MQSAAYSATNLIVVVSLFIGLINVLSYKMPHHIMNIKEYGRATGQSGVISGVLGIAITALMTLALNKFDFFKTMPEYLIL